LRWLKDDGSNLFRAACNIGLEGLVSKRRDRPYIRLPVEALAEGRKPLNLTERPRISSAGGAMVPRKGLL
jgi:hypothetical protein